MGYIESMLRQTSDRITISREEDLEVGPLTSVFPCSESKILDHMVTMRDFDYSISDISRISGVGFKTTLGIVHKLEDQGVFLKTREVGKAIMYILNMESPQSQHISHLAFETAKKRVRELTKQSKPSSKKAKTAQAWKRMKVRKEMEA